MFHRKNRLRLNHHSDRSFIQTAHLIDDHPKLVAGEQLILCRFHLLDADVLLLDARPDLLDVGADLAGLLQELLHRAAGVSVVLGQLQDIPLDGLDVVLQLQLALLHALLAGLDIVDDARHALQQRQDGQGADGVPGLVLHPDDLQLLLDACCAILVLIHCSVLMMEAFDFRVADVWSVCGNGPELLVLGDRRWLHPTTATQTQVWGQERRRTPPSPFLKRIQREPESGPHRDVGRP